MLLLHLPADSVIVRYVNCVCCVFNVLRVVERRDDMHTHQNTTSAVQQQLGIEIGGGLGIGMRRKHPQGTGGEREIRCG